jgi:hypothetical protein
MADDPKWLWIDIRDDNLKKAKARSFLEPLSALGQGVIRDDNDDDDTLMFSSTYLGRPYRAKVGWHGGCPVKLIVKVSNERGDLHVRRDPNAGPLQPEPRDAFDDDDRPPKVRYFIGPGTYIEDDQPDAERQLAMLTPIASGLLLQLLQVTDADTFRLEDDMLTLWFRAHVTMMDVVRHVQTSFELIQPIGRELGF